MGLVLCTGDDAACGISDAVVGAAYGVDCLRANSSVVEVLGFRDDVVRVEVVEDVLGELCGRGGARQGTNFMTSSRWRQLTGMFSENQSWYAWLLRATTVEPP